MHLDLKYALCQLESFAASRPSFPLTSVFVISISMRSLIVFLDPSHSSAVLFMIVETSPYDNKNEREYVRDLGPGSICYMPQDFHGRHARTSPQKMPKGCLMLESFKTTC